MNHKGISTKHPDETLYCKMMEVADKLNAVVVDEDDQNHKYLLPSALMNPSWAYSSISEAENNYAEIF
ncbi:hypothetical protein NUKP68_52860 [Klebsiella variicola]|nr:hypothetical protein NUKP68_52860 [Klebsiella variicola]